MPEAVRCFCYIFADEVRRGMTAITRRNGAMGRFHPAVILLAHDVAISASRRIIRQIRPTLGIGKRVEADSQRNADYRSDHNALNRVDIHLV